MDLPTAFAGAGRADRRASSSASCPQATRRPEQFGIVLDKGSPLTACVSKAVDELGDNGDLFKLQKEWLARRGQRADCCRDDRRHRPGGLPAGHGPGGPRSIALALDRGLRRGPAAGGDVVAGLAAGPRVVLQPRVGWDSLPALLDGPVAQRPRARRLPSADPDRRPRRWPRCAPCAARCGFPLRALATGYVDLFRGLPLLICLYLVGFGLPGAAAVGRPDATRCCSAASRWC